MRRGALLALAAAAVGLTGAGPFARSEEREACSAWEPLRRAWFGDLHVHTSFSFDAWAQGTRATPRDAYRFARGEPLGIQPFDASGAPSERVRLRRPLDFAMVSDHAELLGETRLCQSPGAPGYDSLVCRIARRWPRLAYLIVNSQIHDVRDARRYSFCGEGGRLCLEAAAAPWAEIRAAAEAFYDRSAACSFTTFVGYEWSGNPDSNMIHRNVVFRNAAVPELPVSYLETPSGEGLWRRLRADCLERGDGCDVLAIPHNSNLSGGLLFRIESEDGAPITREDAELRASLEVLVEVTQHKGDSECRAGGSDELCGFETLPFARMAESPSPWLYRAIPPRAYLREALAEGLAQQQRLGVNPFKFGLIGSTDSHLGTPGLVDEDRYPGHAAGTVTRRLEVAAFPDSLLFNPGGLAVLFAEENSRDALFAAMRRREAYATSGPRLLLRLFGGWSYPQELCDSRAFVADGYAGGVPMGGDLPPRPDPGGAPRFAVFALRDPGSSDRPGTPLQRIQIVKGWIEDGQTRERVHEVAGDPASGADVDPASCEPRGRGFDALCQVWEDPDFDASQPAFYYARVVENPSCRWHAWICSARGVDCAAGAPAGLEACCDASLPRTIQERALSSPIWFTP